jgi:hypothetical protein
MDEKQYIERDRIVKFIEDGLNDPDKTKAFGHDAVEILAEIHLAPAADVAPVVHARWIDRDGKTWCSRCDASNKQYKPPYCPHCGARMDGGKHGQA